MYSIYETELDGSRRESIRSIESDSSVEEVLNEFGILEGWHSVERASAFRVTH